MAIPHLKFPMEVIDGRFGTVDQESAAYLVQCVRTLLSTPRGWLDSEPDLGVDDPTFSTDVDLAEIERQLNTYVPELDTLAEEDLSRLTGMLGELGIDILAVGGAP